MIAETISLGILALPKALAILGLIPYNLLPVGCKDWANLFIQRHPHHLWGWDNLDVYCIYHWAIQMPPCPSTQYGWCWWSSGGKDRAEYTGRGPAHFFCIGDGEPYPHFFDHDERPYWTFLLHHHLFGCRFTRLVHVDSPTATGETFSHLLRELCEYCWSGSHRYDWGHPCKTRTSACSGLFSFAQSAWCVSCYCKHHLCVRRTCCVLYSFLWAQGAPGFSEGSGAFADEWNGLVYRGCYCDIRLYWTDCQLTCSQFCRTIISQDFLCNRNTHGTSLFPRGLLQIWANHWIDCDWGCGERPCCRQVHLRPCLPGNQFDA